jgi:hypothetical protein
MKIKVLDIQNIQLMGKLVSALFLDSVTRSHIAFLELVLVPNVVIVCGWPTIYSDLHMLRDAWQGCRGQAIDQNSSRSRSEYEQG